MNLSQEANQINSIVTFDKEFRRVDIFDEIAKDSESSFLIRETQEISSYSTHTLNITDFIIPGS